MSGKGLDALSVHGMVLKFIIAIFSALFGYMQVIVLENIDMFRAIFFIVLLDFFFGAAKAWKGGNFKLSKAMRVLYYLVTYWMILFVVLTIEKSHEYASWLSEAVFLPIIIFQLVSILKNASLIGAIPQGLLLKVLESIDKHKEAITSSASNDIDLTVPTEVEAPAYDPKTDN